MLPKDIQLIKNKLNYEKKKNRLSHDDFWAVCELHHALDGFIYLYLYINISIYLYINLDL